jgi:hypothetical protein
MDVRGARRRDDYYLMYLRFWRRATETDLSQMYAEVVGPLPEPSWKVVSSRKSVGARAYVVYFYGNALAFSDSLAGLLSESIFSVKAKRKAIVTFLGLLQEDDDDTRAGEYLDGLLELSVDWHRGKRSQELLGPDDLPPPPEWDVLGSDDGQ